MRVGVNQLKIGSTIELGKDIYYIVDYKHVKPGKGGAFVRTKLKNIRLNTVLDKTFRPDEKVELAHIEKKTLQCLYASGDSYEFMDIDTYDQLSLHRGQLKDVVDYLKENLEVTAIVYKNKIVTLEPPIFIDLKIISTEPGVRGDTSKAGTKPATLESGMVVLVPLFLNEGDVVRIDTRTKEYVSRA